jgi:hypothetical protein
VQPGLIQSPPPSDRQLRAQIDRWSVSAIVALVHSKVPTIQGRLDFEAARADLDREALLLLAAKTIALVKAR